jgi:parallel beta-helix repeat protein
MIKYFAAFISLLMAVSTVPVSATDWYFSAEPGAVQGSASPSVVKGQGPGSPLAGMESLNSKLAAAQPGDRFFLKRGDRFVGAVRCSARGDRRAPIIISAYGEGPNPLVTDLTRVSAWTKVGINVWTTRLVIPPNQGNYEPSMLLKAGQQIPKGRYPNANAPWGGFLVIGKHEGKTRIIPPGLPASPSWEGADVIMRSNNWVLDRLRVKSHANGVLTFSSESSYEPGDAYGFFIQNHPATLDQEGEWCHDRAKGEILLYSAGDPNQTVYEYASRQILVDLRNSTGISLEGLDFAGSNTCMVMLDGSTAVSISGCGFRLAGRNAIFGEGFFQDFTFCANVIMDTQNNAIQFERARNITLVDNQIIRTALVPGMGGHGDGQYGAIRVDADGLLIEGNRVESTGYMPIYFKGNDVMVRHNVVDTYGTVKDDVGGIYTWSDGRRTFRNQVVAQNMVRNGKGAPEGKPGTERNLVEGIYLDDRTADVRVENNIVYAIADAGVYIHNAHDLLVRDNIFFNNGVGMLFSHDGVALEHAIRNVKMAGNFVFAASANQEMVRIGTWVDGDEPGVEFTGNTYSSPFRKTAQFTISLNGKLPTVLDLSQWVSPSGRDPTGLSGKRFIDAARVEWTGTDMIKNGNFASGLSGWGWWSLYGKGMAESRQAVLPVNTPGSKASTTVPIARLFFSEASKKDNSNLSFWSLPYPSAAGKRYRLRFKARASMDGIKLAFLVRRNADPWNWVSDEVFFMLDREMRDYELVISPDKDEPNSRAEFNIYEKGMPDSVTISSACVELTAVELKEVQLSEIDPRAFYIFEPNFSAVESTITLQGDWIDVKQRPVSGNVTIAPYSAGIFLKADR